MAARRVPVLPALLLAGLLAACSPLVRNSGYVPAESELALLQLGVDTRESVAAAVGRPTTEGVVGDASFFYVQSRFQTLGFLEPREVDRQVLALTFAPDGTLGAVERFGLERGRAVALSRRTTGDVFADTTFVRQILGNIGRVNTGALVDGVDG